MSSSAACLVVALEDDLLAVPSIAGELLANARDHVVQPADVSVDVKMHLGCGRSRVDGRRGQRQAESGGALLDDLPHVILHVATQAGPAFAGAAEGGDVVKIGLAGGG